MQIYLPIAEVSVNVFLLLGLGGIIGFLSGVFGVGGGFLMTPLLIFIGIPPPVAVATQANNVIASSVSGSFSQWNRGNIDFKMGLVLLAGGFAGSTIGVAVFSLLQQLGQIDLVINLSYVVLLGSVGTMMLIEGARALLRQRRKTPKADRLHSRTWLHALPLKTRFRRSRLYVSALLPFGIGFGVGVLSAIMGVGGAFVLVPLMIYLLGMPTAIVVGTSLFQIIFVSINVTFLQAIQNQTVDIVLALLLTVGSVIGAQYGARAGAKLPAETLRLLLGVLILAVAVRLSLELVIPPDDPYSLGVPS
ncbi:MAG TPA: sulfite exporter TauE/SafE family protein [Kiloniellales bacterium]|nr:sulfite exporter TauE/SafE family protein [Kiloniellales bacterium]